MKRILIPVLTILVGAVLAPFGCGSSGSDTPSTGTGGTTMGTGGTTVGPGGTAAKTIEDLIPKANDIPGWNLDSTNPKTAGKLAAFGKTKSEAESLIDGSAAAFFTAPYTSVLAWQNYTNANGYSVDLRFWQMPSVALATSLFTELAANHPLYKNNTWTALTGLGDEARLTNTGTTWWINLRKDAYITEITVDKPPSGSEESDTTGRDVAKAYAAELVKRF